MVPGRRATRGLSGRALPLEALALALGLALGPGSLRGARAQAPAAPLFSRGEATLSVGPTPAGLAGQRAQDCASCHARIAREWRASLHGQAWADPLFARAYELEPLAFCRNCHAPLEGGSPLAPDARSAAEAVNCAVCHLREGQVLGSGQGRSDTPRSAARAHASVVDARLGTPEFCGGCHQFSFPARPWLPEAERARQGLMQRTLEEWRSSSAAAQGRRCVDCHMPLRALEDGRSYRSHDFAVLSSPEVLRGAVRVAPSAARNGTGTLLRVSFENRTGHAFPTGDLFRAARLLLWAEGAREPAVFDFTRGYAPRPLRGADGRAHSLRVPTRDTRLPPATAAQPTHELRAQLEGHPRRLRWRFEHLAMPEAQARAQGFPEASWRRVLAEGVLEVAP